MNKDYRVRKDALLDFISKGDHEEILRELGRFKIGREESHGLVSIDPPVLLNWRPSLEATKFLAKEGNMSGSDAYMKLTMPKLIPRHELQGPGALPSCVPSLR